MAKQLVGAGHEVWGVARRRRLLEELSQQLQSPNFHYTVCDVGDERDVRAAKQEMVRKDFFPSLFILNAAVDIEEPLPGLSHQLATKTLRINLEGALIWVNLFIDQCLGAEDCQFVAVSSLFAHWPDTSSAAYAASKAGLAMAFRSLRLRYREQGPKFKVVYLGPIDTGINPRFAEQADKKTPPWVASAEDASRFIINCAGRRGHAFYYPWYALVLIKFFGWLPDGLFETMTRSVKR